MTALDIILLVMALLGATGTMALGLALWVTLQKDVSATDRIAKAEKNEAKAKADLAELKDTIKKRAAVAKAELDGIIKAAGGQVEKQGDKPQPQPVKVSNAG